MGLRNYQKYESVTPRAGVWIEIPLYVRNLLFRVVTPRAGVWIEIGVVNAMDTLLKGHSPCGSVD